MWRLLYSKASWSSQDGRQELSNHLALEVEGGEEAARTIAQKYGLQYIRQVSGVIACHPLHDKVSLYLIDYEKNGFGFGHVFLQGSSTPPNKTTPHSYLSSYFPECNNTFQNMIDWLGCCIVALQLTWTFGADEKLYKTDNGGLKCHENSDNFQNRNTCRYKHSGMSR